MTISMDLVKFLMDNNFDFTEQTENKSIFNYAKGSISNGIELKVTIYENHTNIIYSRWWWDGDMFEGEEKGATDLYTNEAIDFLVKKFPRFKK